ncbi:MAG TPA: hypothetical protein VM935_06545, partial [Chitinophagaceae bacterium]|nr:hypothetical protein [Chitinophagaceae bacterium]
MNETKIQFSKRETEMMCNADIILTKNRILEKVRLMLEVLQEQLRSFQFHADLAPVFNIPPKISRGENYEGLPYLILDYPRFFKPEDIFAIRTMFWWGNFFSTTLHLSGSHKSLYGPVIEANSSLLAQNNFYVGINANPWAHHFEQSNYQVIKTGKEILAGERQTSHLKLATKIPLDEWPSALDILVRNWKL